MSSNLCFYGFNGVRVVVQVFFFILYPRFDAHLWRVSTAYDCRPGWRRASARSRMWLCRVRV